MELESPITVRYIVTGESGTNDMIYEYSIFNTGFVQIALEPLGQKLNEISYAITKVEVSIIDY